MKKFASKKVLVLVLAFALAAFCLAGYGDDTQQHGGDATDSVTLAFLGPITGSSAAEGAAARNAFELAVAQANESGEFPYEIKTMIIDDQADPSTGVAGAQQIVADPSVVAATGHWNSGVAESTSPVFQDNEIPLLIWGAIKDSLITADTYPWITRSCPTDKQENIPLAQAVLDDMGYEKVFVVSTNDSYGSGNYDAFIAELSDRNMTPVGSEKVATETVDFSAIVAKIQSAGADCVYWGGTNAEGVYLKKALAEAGVDALFCGISGIYTDQWVSSLSAEAAEGTLATRPGAVLEKSEAGQQFIEDYTAAGYAEEIGAYTVYAYDAANILIQALKQCGDAPTAEAMRDAIVNGTFEGVLGTTTFDEIGQTTLVAANLYVVQDGAWVLYEDSEYASGAREF